MTGSLTVEQLGTGWLVLSGALPIAAFTSSPLRFRRAYVRFRGEADTRDIAPLVNNDENDPERT